MGTVTELPEIMSAPQVGQWLGISPQQVRRLAADGKLPGVQVGSLWRFSRPQLLAWLEQGGAS
jgi:excisionase family DNA binding protein